MKEVKLFNATGDYVVTDAEREKMQFKKEFIPMILAGRKTQTRRLKRSYYEAGKIVNAQCGYRSKPFAKLRIINVKEQILKEMSEDEAKAEGFKNWCEFMYKFCIINKWGGKLIDLEKHGRKKAWAIEFEIVK